jgi:phosphatidylglycerophosphatase A
LKSALKLTVTLGGLGYLPASGTFASAAVAGLLFVFPDPRFLAVLFFASAALSIALAAPARRAFGVRDPHPFVMDECAGMCLAVAGFPLGPLELGVGFLFFRLFDVVKPFGIRRIDAWDHPASIGLDDLAAGLYANVALRLASLAAGYVAGL